MRRTTIAFVILLLANTAVRDHDRDIIRFFRQFIRHFIGASAGDNLNPPKPCPPTGC
jgi:hypothetical protein